MNFKEECHNLLKKVPEGKVTTYKDLAKLLNTRAYRAVGRIMRMNANREIPCHRVVCSNGEVGGFNRGKKEKIKLLRKEGIIIKKNRIDLGEFLFDFSKYLKLVFF